MRRLTLTALLVVPVLAAARPPADAPSARRDLPPSRGSPSRGESPSHGLAPFPEDFGPNLLADCPNPEGVAVDPRGFVYASSFAFSPVANVCVLDPVGRVVARIPIAAGPGGVASLLGMLFVPGHGLFVTDFADGMAPHGRLLLVDRRGDVHVVADGFAAPNAIAVDRKGNLYVSDSFAGTVSRLQPDGSGLATWAAGAALTTTGSPPFGANGLAFDARERHLYVANTGDSTVLRIPLLPGGDAGGIEVFARGADLDAATGGSRSLHGADGIQFDVDGNLWVCANQANEIQVLSPGGEIVARYRGTGEGALDFPASLVFRGHVIIATNLSLATGGANSKLSAMRAPVAGVPLVRWTSER
jgi:sugar lactone lactonase YvrE